MQVVPIVRVNGKERPKQKGDSPNLQIVARIPFAEALKRFPPAGGDRTTTQERPCAVDEGGRPNAEHGGWPCMIRLGGEAAAGLHTNLTGGATAVSTNLLMERDARVRQIVAGGSNIHNWLLSEFSVKKAEILHGGVAPLSIFRHDAAFPIPFDLLLGTETRIKMSTYEIVADLIGSGEDILLVGGSACFRADKPAWPCGPIHVDSHGNQPKHIILGCTAVAAVAENNGTGTLEFTPARTTMLGALVLDAVYNHATAPDDTHIAGIGPAKGQRALGPLEITEISINNKEHWLAQGIAGSDTGRVSAQQFAPECSAFFMNRVVSPSETVRVKFTNRMPTGGTNDNDITVAGAFVGCDLMDIGCT